MSSPLTVLFIPLDGYGHLHACIGIAQKLVARGNKVVFALERAWKGKVSRYDGLEEILFVDKTRNSNDGANDHWIRYMEIFKKSFRMAPIESLNHVNMDLEEQFLFTMINVNDELQALIEETKPDVIVVDTYVTIPAVYKSNIPWAWLTSAAPLISLPSDDLPPSGTGYPLNGDRKLWQEYREKQQKVYQDLTSKYEARLKEFDLELPSTGGFMHSSPYLNFYAYPEEMDYLDIRPLPPKWHRFDHFVRIGERDDTFRIPEEFLNQNYGKLIYVSMGSLGCADYELLQRVMDMCAESPNRFIFSMGPFHDRLKLGANSWGKKFVPQTQVLPLVDLVISHGGNNTVVESLYFGKPLIVTPLFGDQRDNAQRVTEVGLGARVNPFTCETSELVDTIERVLADEAIRARVEAISVRLQQSNSTEKAAIAIEQLTVHSPTDN